MKETPSELTKLSTMMVEIMWQFDGEVSCFEIDVASKMPPFADLGGRHSSNKELGPCPPTGAKPG